MRSQTILWPIIFLLVLSGCAPEKGFPNNGGDADAEQNADSEQDAEAEQNAEAEQDTDADQDADRSDNEWTDNEWEYDTDLDLDQSILVATYNVRLFFDTVCDSDQCGPGQYEQALTEGDFREKASNVAAAIGQLGADIVFLQEIEKDSCLDELQGYLALAPPYPVQILGETGYDASLDVGILARGAFIERRNHRQTGIPHPDGGTTYFTREFLEVHLDFGGARVIVFTSHFKSKTGDDPGRRLAEAEAAHEIITERAREFPNALVVFGGDLNDLPGSEPLEALESSGLLLRVAGELSDQEAATYLYEGAPEAIDHLFLATQSAGEYISGSVNVVHGNSFGLGDSDHAALRAAFMF